MVAYIQENAYPKAITSAMAASAVAKLQWNRNPTATPTTTTSASANTLRTRSERVRPASTAERAIGGSGNDR